MEDGALQPPRSVRFEGGRGGSSPLILKDVSPSVRAALDRTRRGWDDPTPPSSPRATPEEGLRRWACCCCGCCPPV